MWQEHQEALDEYRAAAKWYEANRPGWGMVFMDAVGVAVESILDPAVAWSFYRGHRRTPQVYSRSISGFPFDIIYIRIDRVVYVVAYAHERRRPDYWEDRLESEE